MQASQRPESSGGVHKLYHQPTAKVEQYYSPYNVFNNNSNDTSSSGTQISYETQNEQFFTLDSLPASGYVNYDSPPTVSVSSNWSPFSPQCSNSYISDQQHSSDNTYGSPLSGCSVVDDGNALKHVLREMANNLLGPDSDIDEDSSCSFNGEVSKPSKWNRVLEIASSLDVKELLLACAEAVSDSDFSAAEVLMNVLEQKVSVSGEPMQRLSAYKEDVVDLRKSMKERGVKKEPGCSWIEVNKQIHAFIMGDNSHPQIEEINKELNQIIWRLKEVGYVPDTNFVLQDVEGEQMEDSLLYHSEKIAVAFGVMSLSREKTIRIRKNLRICGDCHLFAKLLAQIERRSIVIRDPIRYHHFQDGGCSCGDYW